jgi:hypothetical protein
MEIEWPFFFGFWVMSFEPKPNLGKFASALSPNSKTQKARSQPIIGWLLAFTQNPKPQTQNPSTHP